MIAVVGAGPRGRDIQTALRAAGVEDVVTLDEAPERAEFDDDTDSWALRRAGSDIVRAEVVIAAHPTAYVPWIPNISGHSDFRGDSFHAAAWEPHFHPAGKRVAVIGTDSSAAHHLSRLIESAASVTVFAHAPRRVVGVAALWPTRATRRLRDSLRRPLPRPRVAGAPIDVIAASGIRTHDGVDHPVDAIIYGTGFTISDDAADQALVGTGGVTLRQIWVDGMEPFFGTAIHGFPNYFVQAGPDTGAQARYIAECIAMMRRSGSSRIEVRGSSQQTFNERAQLLAAPPPPPESAFEVSSCAPDYEDTYDGAATLEIGGARYQVRVRLLGHLDPLDGNYHWQGTVFETLPDASLKQIRTATLSVGEHTAPVRIVEKTPWGTHSIAGVGVPPYAGSTR